MDLSFPGQRTATANSFIPHDSVYMPRPRAGKSDTLILDSRYPTMTPKFVKQKSHWFHSSIRIANPVQSLKVIHRSEQRYCSIILQRFVLAHYLPTNPLTLQTSVIYFFCSLKHEKEGECGDLPAMGIPTEPKDELSITYSYSVSFMVSSSNSFILFTFFVSWGTKLSTGRGDYSCGDYIMGNTVMGFVLHVWVVENLESLEI